MCVCWGGVVVRKHLHEWNLMDNELMEPGVRTVHIRWRRQEPLTAESWQSQVLVAWLCMENGRRREPQTTFYSKNVCFIPGLDALAFFLYPNTCGKYSWTYHEESGSFILFTYFWQCHVFVAARTSSSCYARAPHCSGFSLRALALKHGLSSGAHGLHCPAACGVFPA